MSTKISQIQLLQEAFQKSIVIFDGAMGTELYRNHIFTNACFDELNVSRSDLVVKIHASYLEAGAEVLTTNTVSANSFYLQKFGFSDRTNEINAAGVRNAQKAIAEFRVKYPQKAEIPIFIAGSVGPIIDPQRSLTFDQMVAVVTQQVESLSHAGADFIMFETQTNTEALMAAEYSIQRIRETTGEEIPFILSFRPYVKDSPAAELSVSEMVKNFQEICRLHDLPRPFAYGMNCGLGPEDMLDAVQDVLPLIDLPLVVQPEAGAPRKVEVRSISMTSPEFFTEYAKRFIDLGVRGVGGCCGIGPEHILEMARSVKPLANARLSNVKEGSLDEQTVLRDPVPLAERSALGRKLSEGKWVTSVELVPPRGFDLEPTIAKCRRLKALGVDCINIPDGPRASCKISSIVTADWIQREADIETILHFCCRDKNLIGMMADLLGVAACGIRNILFITGDPPKLGEYPDATGVFDTDSVGVTRIQQRMNRGVDLAGKQLPQSTSAVTGVGIDPNALDMEREIARFFRKVEAGAEFAITQPVFDAEVLLRTMDRIESAGIPIIAGIWPLASYRNAYFMKTEVPGVTVPDSIMERMERYEKKEDQQAEGIAIARESIERIRHRMAGIQVSAPFGNIDIVSRVLDGFI
ncbi:MAG: bifunctional homocysteine S-methyltransferase/methylenetetrahydrofolate reductase [Planctomycetaceae bacterium]|nr:bifunctional homocysteine S-methyltransferase/methylenetetrahydrofolate reductase [Planctomycetaceae bacterium]